MSRLLFVFLLLIPGLVFAADPSVGTWKMNVAKSKFSPGPAPKGNTVTYLEEGNWVVTKAQRTDATGNTMTGGNRFKYDGKEYPYEGPYGKGTMSAKRIGDRETTTTIKVGGGSTVTQKGVLSADGKTRTVTTTGKNEQGQSVQNTVVYERQ